jgi:hypothetical protein
MTESDLDKLWSVVPVGKANAAAASKSGNVSICTRAQRSNTSLVGWQKPVAFTEYHAACRWVGKCVCTIEVKVRDLAVRSCCGGLGGSLAIVTKRPRLYIVGGTAWLADVRLGSKHT